ncbi:MAG: UV DNA damage repair endonuclease UvsE [Candidatus Thorarchaeota archaeon]
MKIGYPCVNLTLNCSSSKTFRLKNYSEKRLIETIGNNLECLEKILKFNYEHKILFFRLTSDLIPFASHPIMKFDWQNYFKKKFEDIGNFIKQSHMRITMHPGQYTVLNSRNINVLNNSIKELQYHTDVLDLLKLDSSAKIITHIGGVYGNKQKSLKRFIKKYQELDDSIKNHYVIENDDKSYDLNDCLLVHEYTGIPVILDIYHHTCKSSGESLFDAIKKAITTWKRKDGLPILHYSSEHPTKGQCRHADEIDINHFKEFIEMIKEYDLDIMLEIKDKERSAIVAMNTLKTNRVFQNIPKLQINNNIF